MNRAWNAVAPTCLAAVAAGALAFGSEAALAQASAPSTAPAPVAGKAAAPKPVGPRPSIQLSPAERQAIDAAQDRSAQPDRPDDALAPTAEDIKPRTDDERNITRIEQHRVSNRVSEVVVTPAGQSRSYVMTNREGQQPFGTTQMNSGGLSVPMFFRFEFGRTTPPPTANPPPPPASSPSR